MMDCGDNFCTCQRCKDNEENRGTCSHCCKCIDVDKADGNITECFNGNTMEYFDK